MPSGFDYRRRREFHGWGAKREWPPINPIPGDPNEYVYLNAEHLTETIIEEDCPECEETDLPSPIVITTLAEWAINYANLEFNAATPTSTTYPLANQAVFVPFQIPEDYTVASMAWWNGATVSGNVDVGIYDSSGTRLASSGSTAQAGVSTLQVATVSTTLTSGRYFMALACDNTTATFFRTVISSSHQLELNGVYVAATSFPLPAGPVTFIPPTSAGLVYFGFSRLASL